MIIKQAIYRTSSILRTFLPYRSTMHQIYSFSTEQQAQNKPQASPVQEQPVEDRASNFYRNSIRKININDKGKGKFTQYNLQRLTKLTERVEQAPLLFEAYYNYLGHYTVISSGVVDKMLQKVMNFQDPQLNSVLQVYANHNYLAYFPAYAITQKLVVLAQSNEQIMGKLIKVLYQSPLIKFDKDIVLTLLNYLKSEQISGVNYSSLVKLLVQRFVLNILDQSITRSFLFNQIAESIEHKFSVYEKFQFKKSDYLVQFLQGVKVNQQVSDELHLKLAFYGLSFGLKRTLCESLLLIKDKDKLQRIFDYLKKTPNSYKNSVVSYYQSIQVQSHFRQKLEDLAAEQEQAQSEQVAVGQQAKSE